MQSPFIEQLYIQTHHDPAGLVEVKRVDMFGCQLLANVCYLVYYYANINCYVIKLLCKLLCILLCVLNGLNNYRGNNYCIIPLPVSKNVKLFFLLLSVQYLFLPHYEVIYYAPFQFQDWGYCLYISK